MELKEKVEDFLVNEFAQYMEFIGAKVMMGRVFGLLISQTSPISLTNIAERLKVSKPAISNTVQAGLHSGLFTKVFMPEYPREGFYTVSVEFLEMLVDPGLKKLTLLLDKIKRAKKVLEEQDYKNHPNTIELYNRLDYMIDAFEILLEEYKEFGVRLTERIKEVKKKHNYYRH